LVEVGIFGRGWVTLSADFRRKGHHPPTSVAVIAISCGIKISAVHHLVLSQYMHLTDGRMDRILTAIPCIALNAVAQ